AQRTITLTQSHMVQQVLQRFDFTYSSPQATPLSTRHSLSALPSDESAEPSGPYPELVGCLMYLMTCTRPDLAYPLSILARYVAPGRHRPAHMAAAKRVLRYLCSTSGMGLVLGGRRPVVLTGHADASWADDQTTQRSSQGYTFSLGSGSVSWRSTHSSSVLSSSCEAEIYVGAMAAQELRWLTYLLTYLGEQPRSPPVLYVDNKAMLALCREHRLEHRTKHIALRYFLARELQQRGQLRLAYVASEANTADIFAKALAPGDHQRFCTMLACFALLDWSCDLLFSPTLPMAEEEGRGKRRIQTPNRLTYDALGKPTKSALAGAAMMIGDDEENEYEEFAFAFFSPVEMPGEPATLNEALESSDAEEWKKAMESELKSIKESGTWELVELPEGCTAITSKRLFKIKSDADGKIERYKFRLVAKGYQQKEKVDYKELFAPVVKPTTLRTLLVGAAIKGWVVKQMDVTTAFLNSVLEEEIFMAQPEGFDDGSGRVLRLKKPLYELKQAPRQWYLKLRGVLEEIGFTPSTADHSLFMLGEGEQRSFMVVYVDDILIFSPSFDLVKEVMLKLQDKFKCKALGDMSFYLGLHIERDVEKRCMRCVKGPEEESVGEEERRRFHSLVGSLMYAAVNTRLDIAFAIGQLARVVQCPNEEQVAAGMRVAKYLGQTPTVGLQYSAAAQRRQKGADGVEPGRLFLTAFSDASYASESEDMTSVGGFICCVGGGPTAWESKKQVDQALSSVESEYMALFRAVREIVWQRRLLAELGEEQQGPTPLYCDSQGAIALAKNPISQGHLEQHPLFQGCTVPQLATFTTSLASTASPASDETAPVSTTGGPGPKAGEVRKGGRVVALVVVAEVVEVLVPLVRLVETVLGLRPRTFVDGGTYAPLADFRRERGSGLFTLHTDSPQVVASGQVTASCSCRSLTHPIVLWHHRFGHPSLPHLCGMSNQRLVSGLLRVLELLPPSPALLCTPCVEGRLHDTPQSSSLRPTTAPF
ncbi:unnamed protein product, partial [Closterium sp. NIES-53]